MYGMILILTCRHTLRGHTHAVDKLYLSDDGHRCLSHDSTQMDRSVRMWDLQKGMLATTLGQKQLIVVLA